ncbi:hypothetical protein WISP_87563 [Willisornis vidua]|uniref:Uncharacterized protein n=1 Tax=Willisornis vidua TaxID=1566151 RepID=A0ABQ9D2P6_9PASS|nr:hypothetical protein WISP_87563 [Willisornis vidua]
MSVASSKSVKLQSARGWCMMSLVSPDRGTVKDESSLAMQRYHTIKLTLQTGDHQYPKALLDPVDYVQFRFVIAQVPPLAMQSLVLVLVSTVFALAKLPNAEAEEEMAFDKTSRESEEEDADTWYPRLPRSLEDFVALEKEFNLLIQVKTS